MTKRGLSADSELDTKEPVPALTTEQERLVIAHLPFVKSLARGLLARNGQLVTLDDLVGAGNEGLMLAIRGFDETRMFRFATYARFWVISSMFEVLRDQRWPMHIPESIYRKIMRIRRTHRNLVNELGREPTIEEIANRLDVSAWKTRDILHWLERDTVSLDEPVSDADGVTLGECISEEQGLWHFEPTRQFASREFRKRIGNALKRLTPREERVLKMDFGLGNGVEATTDEIAKSFSISRARVAAIRKRGLRKLRCLERNLRA
jgi:RNA polymerase primary sigma factor